MSDSPTQKTILNAIHKVMQHVLHIVLILPVAALKSVISGLGYIHDELARF